MKLKTSSNLQKQFVGAQKKISKKFCKIHKITHTMESFFINVSGSIFTKERTPCSCSPVKFKGSFRASVYWTTVRRCKRIALSLNVKSSKNVFRILIFVMCGSSHQRFSMLKGVLRNFTNSQENTCARVSFLRCATLLTHFRPMFL